MIRKKKDKILFFKLQIIAAKKKIHFFLLFFSKLGRGHTKQFKGMKNGFYYTSIYCVQTLRFLGGVIGAKIFFINKTKSKNAKLKM